MAEELGTTDGATEELQESEGELEALAGQLGSLTIPDGPGAEGLRAAARSLESAVKALAEPTKPKGFTDFQTTIEHLLRDAAAGIERARQQNLGTVPYLDIALTSIRLLAAAMSGQGECRSDVPFAPMSPVGKSNGKIVYRCSHTPAHEYSR